MTSGHVIRLSTEPLIVRREITRWPRRRWLTMILFPLSLDWYFLCQFLLW
jgi:hypothetical protein